MEYMEKKINFHELEPWIFWILHTLKNDLYPVVQIFPKQESLEADSEFEWLTVCKERLLSGDTDLENWIQERWLEQNQDISTLSLDEALQQYGASTCFVFYHLHPSLNDRSREIKVKALRELKNQKFLHIHQKLVALELQYKKDVEQLRTEVESLENQQLHCHESR